MMSLNPKFLKCYELFIFEHGSCKHDEKSGRFDDCNSNQDSKQPQGVLNLDPSNKHCIP